MGTRGRDHPYLRCGAYLGRSPPRAAAELFHRETVSELDAHLCRVTRLNLCVGRLFVSGGGRARGAEADYRGESGLGQSLLEPAGHGRGRTDDATTDSGDLREFIGFVESALGFWNHSYPSSRPSPGAILL